MNSEPTELKVFEALDQIFSDDIVRAYYSQNHERFDPISRDKQSLPNAMVAIAMAHLNDPNTWTFRNIELILTAGDNLYQDSVVQFCPRNPFLGIRSVLRSFILMHRKITLAVYKPNVHGYAHFYDLYRALLNFFSEESAGIIICDALTLAVFQKFGHYYMFDPHDRDINGFKCESDGAACLLRFRTVENLVNRYLVNAELGLNSDDTSTHFYIMAVDVEDVKKQCPWH